MLSTVSCTSLTSVAKPLTSFATPLISPVICFTAPSTMLRTCASVRVDRVDGSRLPNTAFTASFTSQVISEGRPSNTPCTIWFICSGVRPVSVVGGG
jgi:hypothetical protein